MEDMLKSGGQNCSRVLLEVFKHTPEKRRIHVVEVGFQMPEQRQRTMRQVCNSMYDLTVRINHRKCIPDNQSWDPSIKLALPFFPPKGS